MKVEDLRGSGKSKTILSEVKIGEPFEVINNPNLKKKRTKKERDLLCECFMRIEDLDVVDDDDDEQPYVPSLIDVVTFSGKKTSLGRNTKVKRLEGFYRITGEK